MGSFAAFITVTTKLSLSNYVMNCFCVDLMACKSLQKARQQWSSPSAVARLELTSLVQASQSFNSAVCFQKNKLHKADSAISEKKRKSRNEQEAVVNGGAATNKELY